MKKGNRNKALGTAFENRVATDLQERGFPLVVRSAGSHGPADVLAVGHGVTLAVQCKRNGRMDPAEWNEFWAICRDAEAIPVLALMPGRRGIAYKRLTDVKAGGGEQPFVDYDPGRQWSDRASSRKA